MGITSYAAEALGDVVFAELPEQGRQVGIFLFFAYHFDFLSEVRAGRLGTLKFLLLLCCNSMNEVKEHPEQGRQGGIFLPNVHSFDFSSELK